MHLDRLRLRLRLSRLISACRLPPVTTHSTLYHCLLSNVSFPVVERSTSAEAAVPGARLIPSQRSLSSSSRPDSACMVRSLFLGVLLFCLCCRSSVVGQSPTPETISSLAVYSDSQCSAPFSGLSLSDYVIATPGQCSNSSSSLSPLTSFGTTPLSGLLANCQLRNATGGAYYLTVSTYTNTTDACPAVIPLGTGYSQLLVGSGVNGVCSAGRFSINAPNSAQTTTTYVYVVAQCMLGTPNSAAASSSTLPLSYLVALLVASLVARQLHSAY